MLPTSNYKFRVGICGGGIGGLTLACALSRFPDIRIDIYEAAEKFGEIGAGLGIWPRPWKILQELGLESDLLQITEYAPEEGPVTSFQYRKGDQAEGLGFYSIITLGGLIAFHRAELQQVLLKNILPLSCTTHCSKRLQSYTESSSGPVQLLFEDNTIATCDILVGADGIKSSVRRTLLSAAAEKAKIGGKLDDAAEIQASIDPRWSGTIAYRAVFPVERLEMCAPGHRVLKQPMQYLGKDRHVIAYTISNGNMINVAAFDSRHDLENTRFEQPWFSVQDNDAIREPFANWEPEVQAIINCVDKPFVWAIHTVKPLKSFTSGSHVALIGDAAHAMDPYQGSGAGQSIEDAYVLATILGHPLTTLQSIPQSLNIYDRIRRPFANMVAERSRLAGRYLTLNYKGTDFNTLSGNRLLDELRELGDAITENWQWTWTTTIDDALKQAVELLKTS